MLDKWVSIGRIIHILCGFTALSTGLIIIFIKKGTSTHKILGKTFLLALLTTCTFSLLLQINRYFDAILAYQAVLGIYLGISGFFDFNRYFTQNIRKSFQLILPAIIFSFCIFLLFLSYNGKINKNPSLILASISGGFIFSIVDIALQLRLVFSNKTRTHYLLPHAIKLTTAFIVMLSAFSSTTFNFLETPYKETWPSFIGLPILYFWAIRKLQRK
jgi:hypothetical protein